jgi:two-component system NtrC family sensor kinase
LNIDVTQEIKSELGLDTILRAIAKGSLDLVGGQHCAIGLLENGDIVFHERWNGREWRPVGHRFKSGMGAAGQVLETKRIYIHNNGALAHSIPTEATEDLTKSEIAAPILNEASEVVGVIDVCETKGGKHFTQVDADLLRLLAQQASIAIANAHLFQRSRKKILELSILNHVSSTLIATLNIEEILNSIAHVICTFMGYDVCGIFLKDGSRLKIKALRKATTKWDLDDLNNRYEFEAGIHGWVFREGVSQIIPDVSQDRRHIDFCPGVKSELAAPLVYKGQVIGVLMAGSCRINAFTNEDLKFLSTMGSNLSLAIKNAELFEAINRQSAELKEMVQERTKELEAEKKFVEAIIDALPVGLYVVDRNFDIVAWNKRREVGELGIVRDRALGRNVFDLLYKADKERLEGEFNKVFRTGAIDRLERESDVGNRKRTYSIKRVPMYLSGSEVSHVISMSEDITEVKKMNHALIASEKLASLGQMAAGVAHEINNPLAAIAGCAEAMTSLAPSAKWKNEASSQDFAEYLKIIEEEVYRCKSIIDSLLDFSRTRPAEKRATQVNPILDKVLLLLKHHPRFKNIKVNKTYQNSLPKVYADGEQLKQVFLALALNAMDAMDDRGTLTIGTAMPEDGRKVLIEVADTGCGILEENLKKIFDPFFTTKPPGKGTGLGLSICYRIITDHQGRIEVVSKVNEGCKFTVVLPATGE